MLIEKKYIYKDICLAEAVNKIMNSLEPDTVIESVYGNWVNGDSTVIITVEEK